MPGLFKLEELVVIVVEPFGFLQVKMVVVKVFVMDLVVIVVGGLSGFHLQAFRFTDDSVHFSFLHSPVRFSSPSEVKVIRHGQVLPTSKIVSRWTCRI